MKDLEQRRLALVAESEIYRQSLRLQTMNVRLSIAQTKRRVAATTRPWLVILAPLGLVLSLFQGRAENQKQRRRKRGLAGKALRTFRLYRRFAPVLQPWLVQAVMSLQQRFARTTNASTPNSG